LTAAKLSHNHASAPLGSTFAASRRAGWMRGFDCSDVACSIALFSASALFETRIVVPIQSFPEPDFQIDRVRLSQSLIYASDPRFL
jgi:hypothetical protein